MNAAALARELGVSKQQVSKYKQAGKIQAGPDGEYDLDAVRQQLAQTLGARKGGPPAKQEHPGQVVRIDRPGQDGPSRAQLEREALQERIKRERLRNAQLERTLVDRAGVEAATEARFRADAEALLNWPGRIAAEMAAEAGIDERAMHDLLDKYIRQFMRERSMVAC